MSRKAAVVCVAMFLGSAVFGLDIGDKAPPLNIQKWVKGSPVDPSKPDAKTTYVVEFWATWCPPCRTSIPHLSKVQEHFKDKGVVVIGISAEDVQTVEPFVKAQTEMDYHVAVDDNKKTSSVWMKGVSGIPHAFIVDKNGIVCWTGHPMAGLDNALEGVVAGTFDAETAKKVAAKNKELRAAIKGNDLEGILRIVDELITLEPGNEQHYNLKLKALRYKKDRDAIVKTRQQAAEAFLKAKAHGPLNNLAWSLITDGDLSMRDPQLGLKCAEEAVALTERKSAAALDTLARCYYVIGMLEKAIDIQKEAEKVCEDDGQRESIKNALAFYENALRLRTQLTTGAK